MFRRSCFRVLKRVENQREKSDFSADTVPRLCCEVLNRAAKVSKHTEFSKRSTPKTMSHLALKIHFLHKYITPYCQKAAEEKYFLQYVYHYTAITQ